ncbi:HD-GYP domain-containing protein [Gottschalkiaceae bacterium SANA]|nr:HD-GYP domain-containing protein [Gottschalkiaceae bacterium SANA]
MKAKTKIYLALIYMLGVSALWFMFQELGPLSDTLDWGAIFYLMILSLVTESLQVGYKETSISVGFSVNLAAFLLFGPFVAAATIAFGFFFRVTKKGEDTVHVFNTPIYKNLFNVCSMILCVFLASRLVFLFYDYSVFYHYSGSIDLMGTIVPGVIYAIGFSIANSLLISMLFVTMVPNSFIHYFIENISVTLISSLSIGLISGVLLSILYETLGILGSLLFFLPILYARYTFKLYVDMKDAYLVTISALASSMDAKDHYTQGHSERVSQYAEAIAKKMNLGYDEVENVRTAALLHDIGKIGVPDTILNKPGRLNDEEYKICQRHAEIGHSIVHGISYLKKSEEIIRSHHEHYNGKGYPDGLAGDNVALETYIVALADAYDAMSSDRPYRNALPEEKILSIIAKERGQQFHPEVVDVFLSLKKDGIF